LGLELNRARVASEIIFCLFFDMLFRGTFGYELTADKILRRLTAYKVYGGLWRWLGALEATPD